MTVVLSVGMKAETSLIIKPLLGEEGVFALSRIAYEKIVGETMYIYSKDGWLMAEVKLKDIRHIRFGEPEEQQGVEDVQEAACRVYPNPTKDRLIIDHANCEKVYIFNTNGHMVQSQKVEGEHAVVDVNVLPQGEYLLLLNNQTVKFIKQ